MRELKIAGIVSIVAIIIVGAIIVFGSSTPSPQRATEIQAGTSSGAITEFDNRLRYGSSTIQRFEDTEKGVTCWIYFNQGISCLPNSQIDGGR